MKNLCALQNPLLSQPGLLSLLLAVSLFLYHVKPQQCVTISGLYKAQLPISRLLQLPSKQHLSRECVKSLSTSELLRSHLLLSPIAFS